MSEKTGNLWAAGTESLEEADLLIPFFQTQVPPLPVFPVWTGAFSSPEFPAPCHPRTESEDRNT